jgi:ubiquinone/menaquinone biosynthesis C-methylase UbiE
MKEVSALDVAQLKRIRSNINKFVLECGEKYNQKGSLLLDIAPDEHEGAGAYFPTAMIETLNIDKNSGATYVADLCMNNASLIQTNRFDYIVCTEVLEHTLQPFNAVDEMERMLKPRGLIFISVPFNFRIHGPLPDCWRFTEYGLKALFKNFDIVELKSLEDAERFLMPVHYTLVARKRDEEKRT